MIDSILNKSAITLLIAGALLKFAGAIPEIETRFGQDRVTIEPRSLDSVMDDLPRYVDVAGIRGSIGCR